MSAGAEHGKGNSCRPRLRVVNSNAHRGWRKRTGGRQAGRPAANLRRTQRLCKAAAQLFLMPAALGVEALCGQLYQMASKEIGNPSFGVKSEMLNVDNLL